MIKVTVFAGDGKFTEFEHDLPVYKIIENVLHLYSSSGERVVAYAPGAWLKVERDDNAADST